MAKFQDAKIARLIEQRRASGCERPHSSTGGGERVVEIAKRLSVGDLDRHGARKTRQLTGTGIWKVPLRPGSVPVTRSIAT